MYYREITQPHSTHLMNEQILQNAPSVFADRPYHEVSSRYGFVPTIQMIDALRGEGWLPVDATQKNVRIAEKTNFTKHLVRFRRLEDDIIVGDNDSVVELILTNSHDRSSSFSLHAGVFRMVCANGIVIADQTFAKITTSHSKHAVKRIIEGSYSIVKDVPKITDGIESMMAIDLSEKEQDIFAQAALTIIIPEPKKETDPVIVTNNDNLTAQMLRPKRFADTNTDLWSTFNVIQEKALRGGIRLTKQKPNGQHLRSTTRAVKSIDKNVKLNQALWQMAELMKSLKS